MNSIVAQALRAGKRQSVEPLTALAATRGTVQYTAPEQVESHEADVRADILAVGRRRLSLVMANGLRLLLGIICQGFATDGIESPHRLL
jgi:hypothetical protein